MVQVDGVFKLIETSQESATTNASTVRTSSAIDPPLAASVSLTAMQETPARSQRPQDDLADSVLSSGQLQASVTAPGDGSNAAIRLRPGRAPTADNKRPRLTTLTLESEPPTLKRPFSEADDAIFVDCLAERSTASMEELAAPATSSCVTAAPGSGAGSDDRQATLAEVSEERIPTEPLPSAMIETLQPDDEFIESSKLDAQAGVDTFVAPL